MRSDQTELEREFEDALPEPEADDSAELEAERERLLGEAREHLRLPPHATREVICEEFARDLWQFWLFFFPHYRLSPSGTEIPSAAFHRQLATDLQELVLHGRPGEEMARAYPREHAKSVFTSLVMPIWALASQLKRFAFEFSDTSNQAREFLEDVRTEVETNERLQAIYPDFCEWKRDPRQDRLAFGNEAVMMAAGSGKSVRGARKGARRPDLIVLDDIENDEEVENPQRRKKKMRWFNRVVKKLGMVAVIAIVGTILHAESFLSERVKAEEHIHAALVVEPRRMDLWDEWERVFHDRSLPDSEAAALAFYDAHQLEMDAGAQVLWPERFTLYGLMRERAEDLASFLSERQNRPFDPSASWFPEDRIVWRAARPLTEGVDELPPDGEIVLSVGFWDPARGTTKGDTSSLVRLDCYLDGRRHVRESETDRIPPELVMATAVGLHKRRPFDVLGVEKVGLSSYDEDLRGLFLQQGLATPVEPHTPVGDKQLRIKSLRPQIVAATLTFDEALPLEAKRQIKFYPQHPNDDFPDAVHAANALADLYLQDVKAASASREATREDLEIKREDVFGRSPLVDPPAGTSSLRDRLGSIGKAWS